MELENLLKNNEKYYKNMIENVNVS